MPTDQVQRPGQRSGEQRVRKAQPGLAGQDHYDPSSSRSRRRADPIAFLSS